LINSAEKLKEVTADIQDHETNMNSLLSEIDRLVKLKEKIRR